MGKVIEFANKEQSFTPKGVFFIFIALYKDESNEKAKETILKLLQKATLNGCNYTVAELFQQIIDVDMECLGEWLEGIYNKYIFANDIVEIMMS